ncbi:MAG: hypothetical protein RM338_25780 [Nostoc sp. DedQUE12a]|nr:hypothetical protein [Nostoc sp. DedQUE12a]
MEFKLFRGIDRESIVNAYVDASKTDVSDKFAEISLDILKKKHKGHNIVCNLSPTSTLRKKGTVQRGQVEITSKAIKYNNLPMILVVNCNRKWANPDEIEMQRYALVASISHSDPQVNLYNRMKLRLTREAIKNKSEYEEEFNRSSGNASHRTITL